jgi:chemotaxis protein CheD
MPAFSRWVIAAPKKNLVVGVADMVASNDGSAELVTYSLGSCLGVTVYDPLKKVGGLLHLMLPDSRIDPKKAVTSPFMFVDTGVPQLFKTVFNLGGDRFRVIVKVAGGAQFLDEQRIFNIGERNIQAFNEMISRNGMAVQARDTGGFNSRTLRFDLATGNVSIHSPGITPYHL